MSSFEVEQSFRNIVMFYRKELIHIEKGAKASTYFSETQRKKLRNIGVLEQIYHKGCRLKLTGKTLDILNTINYGTM